MPQPNKRATVRPDDAEVAAALALVKEELRAIDDANARLMRALGALRKAAGCATVEIDGELYQVRERKDFKLYLCKLPRWPGGRPRLGTDAYKEWAARRAIDRFNVKRIKAMREEIKALRNALPDGRAPRDFQTDPAASKRGKRARKSDG